MIPLVVYALDMSSEQPQPVVDVLVATVDLADISDVGGSLCGQGSYQHCHTRPDVGTVHSFAVEAGRSADDRTVRIAKRDPRTHRNQFVNEEEAVLEHLFENQDLSLGLGRQRESDRGEVSREGGPRAVLNFGDCSAGMVEKANRNPRCCSTNTAPDDNFCSESKRSQR